MNRPPPPRTLHYDLGWTTRAFRSRTATQELLSPELEAGILNSHDYEQATNFFPGYHRLYPTAGFVVGGGIAYYALRRNLRAAGLNFRTVTAVCVGACIGSAIGVVSQLKEHSNFLNSVQDPVGFSQALQNVENRKYFPKTGFVLARKIPTSIDEDREDNQEAMVQISDPRDVNARSNPPQPPLQPDFRPARSKWDEIRAANSKAASNSSWDTIRQQHERVRVPSSTGDPVITSETNTNYNTTGDRSSEQAEFDALVERERNMKE